MERTGKKHSEEDTMASNRHLLQLPTPPAHPAGIGGGSWAARGGSPGSRRVKQENSACTALRSSLLSRRASMSVGGQAI